MPFDGIAVDAAHRVRGLGAVERLVRGRVQLAQFTTTSRVCGT
jgi:hypothetical protein